MIEMMTIIADYLVMIVIIMLVSATLQNKQKLEIVSARTIKKCVHWQLIIFVLAGERRCTEIAILGSWGGAISMVLKNQKRFVAHLSCFWIHKILLDHPKKKMFPAKTKKWREQMGQTP
jgi:hypothetical protein